MCQYCKNICSSITTESVNTVVLKSTDLYVNYNDIIDIQKNDSGDITLIETNSNLINRISSNLAVNSKLAIDSKLKNGVEIPVFTFLGIKLISGYGRQVNLKILNISQVKYKVESQFEGRGINQTVHSVYLNIETKMNLIMPFSNETIISNTKVLLCESIIVGKIPNFYLGN